MPQWHPPFQGWLIVVAGIACFGIAAAAILKSRTLLGRRRYLPLVLRMLTLALLLTLLAGPVEQRASPVRPKPARQALLIDVSESMALNTPRSRAASARRVYEPVMRSSTAAESVRLYTFAEALEEHDGAAELGPPQGGTTHLGTALLETLKRSRDTWLTDIVVFSDGRIHDRAQLTRAVMLARRAGIPVSVCPVGHDTAIANVAIESCTVERNTTPETRVPVQVYIRGEGVTGARCELVLTDPDGAELQRLPFSVEEGVRGAELYVDVGSTGGTYALALTELPGEITHEDNRYEFDIEVKSRTLRVLYMEGTVRQNEAWQYEEYEFLTRALEETGEIEVDVLVIDEQRTVGGRLYRIDDPGRGYPTSREELFGYDVVICSDINRHILSSDQMEWTVELVADRGGGFVMIGGYTSFNAGGYDRTVWEQMIPVDMAGMEQGYDNTGFYPTVPEDAREHPILQVENDAVANRAALDAMPPFMGTNLVRRAKPAATVLVEHPDKGIPTICVQPYGRGRAMAFLSDTTSGWGRLFETRWGVHAVSEGHGNVDLSAGHEPPSGPPPAEGGDNTYFRRFWINAIRWLARNSVANRHARMLVNTDRVTYRPGDDIKVRVRFLDTGDRAVTAFRPTVRLARPDARAVPLTFDEAVAEYTAILSLPADSTDRSVDIEVADISGDEPLVETVSLGIVQRGREFRDPQPDHETLGELAKATSGRIIRSHEDLEQLLEQRRENMPEPVTFRVPRWDRAWLWGLILVLLSAEWFARRR